MRNRRLPTRFLAPLLAALAAFAAPLAAAQEEPPPKPADAPAAPPADPQAPAAPKGVEGGPPPDSPSTPPRGADREQMWPAATAEGWRKPVLVHFQRTWDDAVKVAKETGKPILICVNMDGEIASEHYAGVRYRDPEVAKLYEPYVCVIASVYRHNPRDYDDEGHRILCPRFGSVTCGEHIWIEPILFERFFDGKRIAPRHVMVEPDGKETFDVFYANDTASVFRTIRDGIANRGPSPPPVVRGDRPVVDRVASPDAADRDAVESAYAKADPAERRALLEAAVAHPENAPVDLLRLAVLGLDPDLSKVAREALAKSDSPAATDVIAEALKVPMSDAERDALVAALQRIGETSPRAKWIAIVQKGLSGRPGEVDVSGWTKTLDTAAAPPATAGWYELEDRRKSGLEARRERPDDPEACLSFAETSLALGRETQRSAAADDPKMARVASRLLFEDARRGALQAETLKAPQWRVDTVLALADFYSDRPEDAYPRAEAAVKAMPPGETSWNSMAVLTVYAESRWKAIQTAVREKKPWPPQWLTDVNAAYSVLRRHPHGNDGQVAWHYDFLTWLNAFGPAGRVLDEGLARFSDSRALHERFRARTLRMKGPDGLEAAYDAMLAAKDAPPVLERYAAWASMTAAEIHRRRGERAEAAAAYDRATAHQEKAAAAEEAFRPSADHWIALTLAARARMALEDGDLDGATAGILASFERSPGSAGSQDGLGITPAATAQALLAKLEEAKRDDLATKLGAALGKIDPALLPPN